MTMNQVFDAVLELCDVICCRYDTEELCESIVADVELSAAAREFEATHIGQALRSGRKVRFEGYTHHEGHAA